ncbi:hypothetical protein [Tenacibaculum finnmarkense]|uniref:tRNA (Guanine-N1)-methyltransferase n=1 Tax=Tenacibaculum finnmarkense genomovar ulcerans TaxID=2781388 RepID=A0A2I2MAC1_9FLAO|nr:hypothetical protein [Tenacibaculum finnmarkense]ALU75673.1 hypothetical protein AUW17_10600 [Tenacibaculum dicentrarchi]MBE7633100.1 hypothetical protein [Tenacibaculum finnmarkense genomovar ulcerans]MBE7644754.1 hypothetical protein [Tenacibaculum finnmarkense genomovar ulcerans]MBE7686696.1 hypothetical protein [Tenacibaculum finnmarkense genomovar ulcerans]MBE7696938.1 hypothetical protein [Tenacibaculum finnmarkense genomovar ulcerans]
MKILRILLLILITQNITAQKRLSKAQVDSLPNTIENQFIKAYRLSNNWQEYKLIKRTHFINFQKNILDSVTAIKKDVLAKQLLLDTQLKNTNTLKEEIATLKNSLSVSLEKEDAISIAGFYLNKTTYNTILWSIICGLLIGLGFFIFKFNSSHSITKETKGLLVDVEEELEQYKRSSIDKEQKLRRQLQDEINKQRGV